MSERQVCVECGAPVRDGGQWLDRSPRVIYDDTELTQLREQLRSLQEAAHLTIARRNLHYLFEHLQFNR